MKPTPDSKLAELKRVMESTGLAPDILNYRKASRRLGKPIRERKSRELSDWKEIEKDPSRFKLLELEEIDYYNNWEKDQNFDRVESIGSVYLFDMTSYQDGGNRVYQGIYLYTNVLSLLCDDDEIVEMVIADWEEPEIKYFDASYLRQRVVSWEPVDLDRFLEDNETSEDAYPQETINNMVEYYSANHPI